MSDAESDIWKALEDAEACMLADHFGEGLRARPMRPLADREGHAVWFITDRDSPKVEEIKARPEVCLTLSRPGKYRFVSVTGSAALVDDREKLHGLWTPADDAWFDGPEDPRAILLRVTPRQGQIWEGPGQPRAAMEVWFKALTGGDAEVRRVEKTPL